MWFVFSNFFLFWYSFVLFFLFPFIHSFSFFHFSPSPSLLFTTGKLSELTSKFKFKQFINRSFFLPGDPEAKKSKLIKIHHLGQNNGTSVGAGATSFSGHSPLSPSLVASLGVEGDGLLFFFVCLFDCCGVWCCFSLFLPSFPSFFSLSLSLPFISFAYFFQNLGEEQMILECSSTRSKENWMFYLSACVLGYMSSVEHLVQVCFSLFSPFSLLSFPLKLN